ncbi:DNA polymerase IV [Enterococcus faecium]|nr:DNA polymerase IV [Enterococcus faecium]
MMELQFPLHNDTSRKIIHIDMDAFFASVEERDHPEFRGHPLVIARHPSDTGGRGVVTTANYEARKFGIHSAMSAQKAYELCPQAIFKPGDHHKYSDISKQVREVFYRYTDIVEPVSIDEAYLDVTENKINCKSAIKIARMIQADIWESVQLTCSAGVSYNKFLAELASDYQKPRGITVVAPQDAVPFLKALPIEKFHGVGKKVRGIHDSPVNVTRERKSVGKEHTYGQPLQTEEAVLTQLRQLAEKVEEALRRVQKHGKTVVLKVRYTDYSTVTKRVTLPEYIYKKEALFYQASLIWEEILGVEKGIRLLGITLTNLDPMTYENIVLPLWENQEI